MHQVAELAHLLDTRLSLELVRPVHDHADQCGIVMRKQNDLTGVGIEPLPAVPVIFLNGGSGQGFPLTDELLDNSLEKLFLAGEIIIDCPLAKLGLASDLLQRGFMIPFDDKKFSGRSQDFLPVYLFFPLLAGQSGEHT